MRTASLFLTTLLLLSPLFSQVKASDEVQESEVVQEQDESLSAQDWSEIAKLLAADGEAGDLFGYSVSISGDTVVVGARFDDDNGDQSGSVYIFERNQGGTNNWGEVKKLLASDGEVLDYFGGSVSISGDSVVVGAFGDDDNGDLSGSAYIFERNQGGTNNWGEVKKLLASAGEGGDIFGNSVSISGDTAIIGAYGDDDNGIDSGSAYVLELLSNQESAQKYAPYLYRHRHETYWPISIEPVVKVSVLHYSGGSVKLSDPAQLANELYNDPDSYLKLPYDSKEDLDTYFKSVWNKPEWQPHAYARVYKNPDNPENVVIQY